MQRGDPMNPARKQLRPLLAADLRSVRGGDTTPSSTDSLSAGETDGTSRYQKLLSHVYASGN
jgi:hypothetical protein